MGVSFRYSMSEAKSVLNGYIQLHNLINETDPSHIVDFYIDWI